MKILVTGFEPFAGSDVNPSQRASVALAAAPPPPGIEIAEATLPCTDAGCASVLMSAVQQHQPDAVIALGEHGRETGLAFELFALNLRHYRIPDNDGVSIKNSPVVKGAPTGFFTDLPAEAMVKAARSAGVPARTSRDAGTFLCNQAYFILLHARATGAIACPSIFVHVPRLPEQAAAANKGHASMTTETVTTGLRAAISMLESGSGTS